MNTKNTVYILLCLFIIPGVLLAQKTTFVKNFGDLNQKDLRQIDNVQISLAQKKAKKSLSMQRAVELAIQYRPSLLALKFSTEAARAQQNKQLAQYFPQISFNNLVYSYEGISGIHEQATVNASQLLYSFASPIDLYRAAEKNTRAARQAELAHQDLIRNQVETSFLQAWLYQKQSQQVMSQMEAAESAFARAQTQNFVQLLDRNDWLLKNVTYSQVMTEASNYKENVSIAQSTLEQAISKRLPGTLQTINEFGHEPATFIKLEWNQDQEIELKPLEHYKQLSHENRKEIKIFDNQIAAQRITRAYNLNQYLPSFSISASAQASDIPVVFTDIFAPSNVYKQATFNVNWNLFDGLSAYRDYQTANAQMLNLTCQKSNLIQQIDRDIETVYYQTQQQIKLLEAAYVSFLQQQNEYELKKQQFFIGLLALPDLDAAIFNHDNAYFSWVSQRIQVELKLRLLYFTCGYPTELT